MTHVFMWTLDTVLFVVVCALFGCYWLLCYVDSWLRRRKLRKQGDKK